MGDIGYCNGDTVVGIDRGDYFVCGVGGLDASQAVCAVDLQLSQICFTE